MATLEELQRRKRQIEAQISDKKRALAREERKARNHALMVAGGLVLSHAPGGDWKRVDWDALAAWLDRYGYKVAECEAEELATKDAAARLREWERKGRAAGERQAPQPGQADGDGDGSPSFQ